MTLQHVRGRFRLRVWPLRMISTATTTLLITLLTSYKGTSAWFSSWGIPYQNVPLNFSMSGFGKDPRNPFTNNVQFLPGGGPNPMYSGNRQTPYFEFAINRLALDPHGTSGIPGYLDSFGEFSADWKRWRSRQPLRVLLRLRQRRDDSNDVNFVEADSGLSPPSATRSSRYPVGLSHHLPCNWRVLLGRAQSITSTLPRHSQEPLHCNDVSQPAAIPGYLIGT